MDDVISRQALIEHLRRTIEASSNDGDYSEGFNDGIDFSASFASTLPSAQPELKWETCFDCPLSNGCPKIRGCTNDQAEQYASETPADCPLNKASAQPEQRWIPCSEQLPEYGRTVLWCNEHGSVFTSAITYMKDNTFSVGQHSGVIAWTPLPEPYIGGMER